MSHEAEHCSWLEYQSGYRGAQRAQCQEHFNTKSSLKDEALNPFPSVMQVVILANILLAIMHTLPALVRLAGFAYIQQ